MRNRIISVLLIILFSSLAVYAQTADEIIENALKVQGNDNLKKIKSLKLVGKLVSGAQEIPFKMFYKAPKSLRSEMSFNGKTMIQGFDGNTGWYINPNDPNNSKAQKMPAEMLARLKEQSTMLESPLADYKKKGIKVQLMGKKKVDGKEAFRLKLKEKKGAGITVYIDCKTYIMFKTVSEMKQGEQKMNLETSMMKHLNISGVMIPHLVENKVNGKVVSKMVLDKVESNTNIDDSMFKMPK